MKLNIIISILFIFVISSCQTDKPKATNATQEETLAIDVKKKYTEKGKKIAKASFMALSGKLQNAMKEGGVSNAMKYCNSDAMSLTDSLSKHYNATIKRTSMKYRNPKNKPSIDEAVMLEIYENQKKAGIDLKPIVNIADRHTIEFFAPIPVKPLCLTCHGDLNEETKGLVEGFYPKDKAQGYKMGDLRGAWHISFER